jgi:hypothetical protein
MVIVAASANGKVGIEAAVQILREGGTAVDAERFAAEMGFARQELLTEEARTYVPIQSRWE